MTPFMTGSGVHLVGGCVVFSCFMSKKRISRTKLQCVSFFGRLKLWDVTYMELGPKFLHSQSRVKDLKIIDLLMINPP